VSVARTGLVAWPLKSCSISKNDRHNARRYGELATCCDASYRQVWSRPSFVIAMEPGQRITTTTPTHAKIATDYWLPLWSVNVAQAPGSDSRIHWIGAERPTRDFIVGRGQASQEAPKEMRWCINSLVDDKKPRTKDRNRAGRWYILVATVPDVDQRYKNRGYRNTPTSRTESIRSSKPNGGRSISQISRAKGRAEVCPSCKLSGTRSGTSDKGKALAADRHAKWSVQQRPDSMKRTP
jgi:hypothetical protein